MQEDHHEDENGDVNQQQQAFQELHQNANGEVMNANQHEFLGQQENIQQEEWPNIVGFNDVFEVPFANFVDGLDLDVIDFEGILDDVFQWHDHFVAQGAFEGIGDQHPVVEPQVVQAAHDANQVNGNLQDIQQQNGLGNLFFQVIPNVINNGNGYGNLGFEAIHNVIQNGNGFGNLVFQPIPNVINDVNVNGNAAINVNVVQNQMQINQGDGHELGNLAGDFAQEQEIGADEVYVWLYNPQDGGVNNMVGAEIIDGALGVDDGFNLIDWEAQTWVMKISKIPTLKKTSSRVWSRSVPKIL